MSPVAVDVSMEMFVVDTAVKVDFRLKVMSNLALSAKTIPSSGFAKYVNLIVPVLLSTVL